MSRFADAVRAALEINGVRTRPIEPPSAPAATPTPAPAKRQRRDRVLVLGGPGVLVRDRDGRLPRDGEVEPDGACLRVAGPGGPVLVAGSLRTPPTACRWAVVADLHPIDLEVLRRVAPAHAAEAQQRERVAGLTRDVARELGVAGRGTEATLLAVLDALRARPVDLTPTSALRAEVEAEVSA